MTIPSVIKTIPSQDSDFINTKTNTVSDVWYRFLINFASEVGSGILLASNNLSDVVSPTTSLSNIGGSPLAGSSSLITTGTITTGTWGATKIALSFGGTNATLTANNGGIVYSTASALAILAGTVTANQILLSGSNATPSWSTATFPGSSATTRKIIVSDGTNWVASTETYAVPGTSGKILQSDGTNWISATPTGSGSPVLATSPSFTTPILGTPTSGTLTNCIGYTDANLSLSDITTNNASTSNHGFLKKLDNNAGHIFNGAGNWFIVPSARAYNSSSTTLAANAFTKVGLQTKDWDVGTYFDATTNYRYTPLVAGIYQVTGMVSLNTTNITATNRYITCVYKNGSLEMAGTESAAISGGNYTSQSNGLISMNGSTDYLELFFYNSNATNSITTTNARQDTYLTATWVGPLS